MCPPLEWLVGGVELGGGYGRGEPVEGLCVGSWLWCWLVLECWLGL